MARRLVPLTWCAISLGFAGVALGQSHPTGVPSLASRPGAAYTIYLDFGGFSYTGSWGGATPGTEPAYDGVTTSFGTADQANIAQVWARVAEKYAAFNVNVTTIDPAVAAGKAGSDSARQAYYDATAQLMHTVIADNTTNWTGGGGVSYVGVTPGSYTSGGFHTDWVFPNRLGGAGALQVIGEATAHENGHGLGLDHQGDYNGTTLVNEYSENGGATGPGTYAPVMGESYYTQRGLWRVGNSDPSNGSGSAPTVQNDANVIVGDPDMNGFVNDGVGHTPASATPLPLTGSSVNAGLAKGVIVPASSTNPTPIGAANYVDDYFKFQTSGGTISLTAHDGGERITAGTPDPGGTLDSILRILDAGGHTLYTAADSVDLQETITQTLAAGTYYVEVSSAGGKTSTFDPTATYYDIGDYFLTGTGFGVVAIPEPASAMLLAIGGALLVRRTRRRSRRAA